jgi:hypothetical protein
MSMWKEKEKIPRLENWCVTGTPLTVSLVGNVYDHMHIQDGWSLETDPIVSIDGRKIRTYIGKEYTLGKIELCFKSYLLSLFDDKFDEENPLLFLGELFDYKKPHGFLKKEK